MTAIPDHLFQFPVFHTRAFKTPRRRAWAARQPYAERIRMINDLLFPYDQFQKVTTELKQFHLTKGIVNKGRIFGVVGEFRTGKTYAVQHYFQPFLYRETNDGDEFPALYLQASEDWGADGLPRAIIEAVGDVARASGRGGLRNAAIARVIDHNVQTIVVEDIHLFNHKPAALAGFLGFIQLLLSKRLCAIFVVTSMAGAKPIYKNKQIRERGGFEVTDVKAFNPKGEHGRRGLKLFLNGVDERLPFLEPSNLKHKDYVKAFFELSMNAVPQVMNVIRTAALRAIEDDEDYVSRSQIEAAFRRQITDDIHFSGLGVRPPVEMTEEEAGMYV